MARITAWRPLQDIFSTRREIDRIFDNFFHNQSEARPATDSTWSPPVDVVDSEDHVEFHAEVPGMTEDDVKVSITENVLNITGEKKTESEDSKDGYHLSERSHGQFQRSFTLPGNLVTEDIAASCKNGVLSISVPKVKKEEARQIPVNAGK
ncbi:MAG: Hsp20/alpha crystallin family protein [Candidatus Poribacteria bacterium]|nr:Hsp20/alpha crystallin family protein [Candidatus Poribacteria bacterium]MDE0504565.1 Hsp20/alpha crystallin family protein [Candidatus Poribacteria bacterium]